MNPYARFRLVSNALSAALILSGIAAFGLPAFQSLMAQSAAPPAQTAAFAAIGVTIMVVFWVTMTEAVFPALFRFDGIRRLILGKHYMEGTWLQSERGSGAMRMSVIDIQPKGNDFMFTGYALNENLEIESNTRIEFSKFDWPFMTYKHRNSLSDGSDGLSEGVGELQFEMNRSSARRYNGFLQYVRGQQRLKIEGVKLTSGREVRHLRTLQGRREVCAKYWELFYNQSLVRPVATVEPVTQAAPSAVSDAAPAPPPVAPAFTAPASAPAGSETIEQEGDIIPRRRASDWNGEDVKARSDDAVGVNGLGVDIDRLVDEARRETEKTRETVNAGDYRKRPVL